MSKALAIYLRDHLAGSNGAIDLIEYIAEQNVNEDLGQFAKDLLVDVKQDKKVLKNLAEQLDVTDNPVKQASAWVGEKATRLKLDKRSNDGLGNLQALESLGLGIQGKLALWKALKTSTYVERFPNIDFQGLIKRAQNQYDRVEKHRLVQAKEIFGNKQ